MTATHGDSEVIEVGGESWRLWRSDSGGHYATRATPLTDEQACQLGYARTVFADTRMGVVAQIHAQADMPDLPETANT